MKKSIVAALWVVLSLCVVSCGKENQKPSESSFKMDKEISEPDNVIEEPEREEPEVEVVPEVNPEAE
ncbi:MAG: hypothetical protein PUD20_11645 [bacterium]|nr:hypothetical protein [bacterium]